MRLFLNFAQETEYSISVQSDIIQNMSFDDARQCLESLLTVHIWG
jgi:hypothetical protein